MALRGSSFFGGMSVPKVSIDHRGFAGTITHTDVDDTEKETREKFMYMTNRHITSTRHRGGAGVNRSDRNENSRADVESRNSNGGAASGA